MNQALATRRCVWFLGVVSAGLILDLASKAWVFERLGFPAGESQWVGRLFDGWLTFRFYTSVNEGALWGIGQGFSGVFSILSLVAVTGILLWMLRYGAARSAWLTTALALILAGTLGNLWDRVGLHGIHRPDGTLLLGVRDFLLFTFGDFHWPVFNLADSFLVTGAVMLGAHSFRAEALKATRPDMPPESLPVAGAPIETTLS